MGRQPTWTRPDKRRAQLRTDEGRLNGPCSFFGFNTRVRRRSVLGETSGPNFNLGGLASLPCLGLGKPGQVDASRSQESGRR